MSHRAMHSYDTFILLLKLIHIYFGIVESSEQDHVKFKSRDFWAMNNARYKENYESPVL
jgi:hypothetical protein